MIIISYVQRIDLPIYLDSLKEFDLEDLFDKEGDEFYEFIFKNYPMYLPDDTITLQDIIEDITPEILLEYFLEKGRVKLC